MDEVDESDASGDVEVIELNEDQDIFNAEGDGVEDEGGFEGDEGYADQSMDTMADDAEIVFRKHTGSVFCCDLDPMGQLAVSGGEDDRAYVWSIGNGEVIFECTDHRDSVTCAAFSHDGKLIATGDMSGVIQVWQVATRSKTWSFETSDLAWLQWHPSSHVLLAGTVDGSHWMWHIPSGECKTFTGAGSPSECCKILADGKRAAIGYGNGSVRIWDLKTATALYTLTDAGGDVTCIDGYHDNNLVLSGSVDGTARLFSSLNGKTIAALNCVSEADKDAQNSVESVGFCSNFPFCATGTLKGQMHIWDIPTQVLRQTCDNEVGIVRLVWDRGSPLVYTAGMDGAVRLWDARSGRLSSVWTGHAGEILDAVLSRDGGNILTASDDKTCRVFNVNRPDR